jgi:hypothetical protein
VAADPQQGNGQTDEEFADAAIQANAILGVKGGDRPMASALRLEGVCVYFMLQVDFRNRS